MRTSSITFNVIINPTKRDDSDITNRYKNKTASKVVGDFTFDIECRGKKQQVSYNSNYVTANLYTSPDKKYGITFAGTFDHLMRLQKIIPVVVKAIKSMGFEYWLNYSDILQNEKIALDFNQVPKDCEEIDAHYYFFACCNDEWAANYLGWYFFSFDRYLIGQHNIGNAFTSFLQKHNIIEGYDESIQYFYCFKKLTVNTITDIFRLSMVINLHERTATRKIREFSDNILITTGKCIYDDVALL